MQLHTFTEVLEDIRAFEGVTVKLREETNAYLDRVHFVKLYSEHYPKPMSGQTTVDELLKRVQEFTQNDEIALLPFDKSPMDYADEYSFVVYRVLGMGDKSPHLQFIEATSDQERLKYYLSAESNEMALCVVFIDEEAISYHQRNVN
jgi:hypothetical protein